MATFWGCAGLCVEGDVGGIHGGARPHAAATRAAFVTPFQGAPVVAVVVMGRGGGRGCREGLRRGGTFGIKQRIVRNALPNEWVKLGCVIEDSGYRLCREGRVHRGVQLDHVCRLSLAGVRLARRVGARHAVFARVVLTEGVVCRCHRDVGTARTAGILRRQLALGREEAQVRGLGESLGGRWRSRRGAAMFGRRH